MANIISAPDVSKWPLKDFERRFYKEVDVNGFKYLAPCTKLGVMQIARAEKARRDDVAKTLPEGASDEVIDAAIRATTIGDACTALWLAALWIPLAGSPTVLEIYQYIPTHLIRETQDFFVMSYTGSTVSPDVMESLTANDGSSPVASS